MDTNLISYPTYENVLVVFRPKVTFKYYLRKNKKVTVPSHEGFGNYLPKITRGAVTIRHRLDLGLTKMAQPLPQKSNKIGLGPKSGPRSGPRLGPRPGPRLGPRSDPRQGPSKNYMYMSLLFPPTLPCL